MNPETRWMSIFSALLLLLGIFIGIAMDRFLFLPAPPVTGETYEAAGHRRREHPIMRKLAGALDLTEEQRADVGKIFKRQLPRLRRAWRDEGDIKALRQEMHEELSEVLNEDQLKKFEEMRRHESGRWERFRARRKEHDQPATDRQLKSRSPGSRESMNGQERSEDDEK